MITPLIYSSKMVQIPVPRFVVFYNGTQEQPERRVLRLSDAFEKKVSSPELEVTVTMLNINPGNNRELMEKCRTLREYCMFVECIRNDILADFLSAQRAEVIAMSIFEYNEEEEMKKIRADEFSVGRENGKAEGKAEFVIELLENLGEIPDSLRERILSESDLSLLKKWFSEAVKAKTVGEFMEQAGLSENT